MNARIFANSGSRILFKKLIRKEGILKMTNDFQLCIHTINIRLVTSLDKTFGMNGVDVQID